MAVFNDKSSQGVFKEIKIETGTDLILPKPDDAWKNNSHTIAGPPLIKSILCINLAAFTCMLIVGSDETGSKIFKIAMLVDIAYSAVVGLSKALR